MTQLFDVLLVSTLPGVPGEPNNMKVLFMDVRAEDDVNACAVARDHMATPHHWYVSGVSEGTL